MKRTNLVRQVGALVLAAWAGLVCVRAENAAAVNEVLKLKNAGVNEDTIVAFIQGKNVNYDLSADNILALRDKGVSQAVLNAMLASGTAAKGRNFETVKILDLPTPSSARGHEHYDARQKTMEVYRPKFGGHK